MNTAAPKKRPRLKTTTKKEIYSRYEKRSIFRFGREASELLNGGLRLQEHSDFGLGFTKKSRREVPVSYFTKTKNHDYKKEMLISVEKSSRYKNRSIFRWSWGKEKRTNSGGRGTIKRAYEQYMLTATLRYL